MADNLTEWERAWATAHFAKSHTTDREIGAVLGMLRIVGGDHIAESIACRLALADKLLNTGVPTAPEFAGQHYGSDVRLVQVFSVKPVLGGFEIVRPEVPRG